MGPGFRRDDGWGGGRTSRHSVDLETAAPSFVDARRTFTVTLRPIVARVTAGPAPPS